MRTDLKIHPEDENDVNFPSDLLIQDIRFQSILTAEKVFIKVLPLALSRDPQSSREELMEYCIDISWLFQSFRDSEIQKFIDEQRDIEINLKVPLEVWEQMREISEETFVEMCLHHYNGANYSIGDACREAAYQAANFVLNSISVFDSLNQKQKQENDREQNYGRLKLVKK